MLQGVICGQKGEWILGYNHGLRSCSIFEAKLQGILNDLTLITERGHKNILVHTDSLKVIIAVQTGHLESSPSTLVRRIHLYLQTVEQWNFTHIPREKNRLAYRLAKMTS